MLTQLEEEFQGLIEEKADRDGYTGEVLDMVHRIFETDGEHYSDEECLLNIRELVNHWDKLQRASKN